MDACGAPVPGSGIASLVGASLPGSGIAAEDWDGGFGGSPGSGTASSGVLDGGLIGKSVWHFEHFSFAPPGGTRLSSML